MGNNPVSFIDPTGHEIQTPIDSDSRATLAQGTLSERIRGTYIPEGGRPYGWSDPNQKGWTVDYIYGGWVRVQNLIIAYTQVRDSEGRVHMIEQYMVDEDNPDSYRVRLPSAPPGYNLATELEEIWNFAGFLAESAWKDWESGVHSFWNFGLSSENDRGRYDSGYGTIW